MIACAWPRLAGPVGSLIGERDGPAETAPAPCLVVDEIGQARRAILPVALSQTDKVIAADHCARCEVRGLAFTSIGQISRGDQVVHR